MLPEIKKFSCAAVLVIAVIFAASHASAATLPDVEGWICGELRATQLDALSGNHGAWFEREYITERGEKFLAILMEGAGAKLWKQPQATGAKTNERATAEQISVAGCDAVIESRPVLGLSLIVKLAPDTVLTLESQYGDKDELARAAEILIARIIEVEFEYIFGRRESGGNFNRANER